MLFILAVLGGVLVFAGNANATVKISSLGGTTSIQATDDLPVDLSVTVEPVAINSGGLTCNTSATDACDEVISLGDGSEMVAGAGCIPDSSQGSPMVVCPDVGTFTAGLGSGNDRLVFLGDLEYDSATVDGGAGNDTLTGASPSTPAFADVDNFSGGAGDDTIKGNAGKDILDGGPGTDFIDGGEGNDTLTGGDGADRLNGGSGDDSESGGAGNDTFNGAEGTDAGNDTFIGGPDQDTVDYLGSSQPVSVSLDGAANDGQPGEADNVMPDIEELDGTAYADTLSAGATGATMNGNGGNDTMTGGSGNDTLIGGGGDDTETGGGGTDSFFGDDMGCGGFFDGCNAGNDTINAIDGVPDQINCGPGADVAHADAVDIVATDPLNGCETVTRAQGPPGPVVTTGAASGIGPTAAHVSGTVNPNGSVVSSCRVEYGTTSAYGASAPCAQAVGGGTTAVTVSSAFSGLRPSTVYHYRFAATNPRGTGVGSDNTLKTRSTTTTHCVAPRLRHLTLDGARRALRRAQCRLGRVHRPHHVSRRHRLRVSKQSASPRSVHRRNYPINITLT